MNGHSYKLQILHRPIIGLIRVKIWEGGKMIADTGNIIDDGPDSFKGGRLGVYCDSQAFLTWSAINYR